MNRKKSTPSKTVPPDAWSIVHKYAGQAGWSENIQLCYVVDFIDREVPLEKLDAYLKMRAEEERESMGRMTLVVPISKSKGE